MNNFLATVPSYQVLPIHTDDCGDRRLISEEYWSKVIADESMTKDCLGVPRWVWILPCSYVLDMMKRDSNEIWESDFDQTRCPWFLRPFNDAILDASLFELGLNIWRDDSLFQGSDFILLMKYWVALAIFGNIEVETLDAMDEHDGLSDALDFWNDQD